MAANPEMAIRRALQTLGLRYRVHDWKFAGTSDFIFRRFETVCLVHVSLSNRHVNFPYVTFPATRLDHWPAKFSSTMVHERPARAATVKSSPA
ncbi:MAG: hypothetical protein F4213_12040 [Boseongicola sp. SB0677_bin_26]|nr:hypothetical protein [Boseongicola sp. SB0665_bin_10]MYG26736.1 hypothetical protein [Boseongicola sp. SB0677_bin_26]